MYRQLLPPTQRTSHLHANTKINDAILYLKDDDGSDEDNSFGDNPNHQRQQHDRGQQHRNSENNRWTSGIKLEIPEFHGSSRPEELLDWFVTVDEFLEFKDVPTNKQAPLVTTRFRGHAASLWNQLKLSRSRRGKEK